MFHVFTIADFPFLQKVCSATLRGYAPHFQAEMHSSKREKAQADEPPSAWASARGNEKSLLISQKACFLAGAEEEIRHPGKLGVYN